MNPAPLLTAKQIATQLGLPHDDYVKALARKRKIPSVRLGYRTIRFDAAKVAKALEKLEVRAV